MGRAFVMRSVVSTLYFPLALELAQKLTQPEISSTPAAAAAAGALLGIGGALVIIGNGSQGGFDIIAIILRQYRAEKKCQIPPSVI